MRIFKNNNRILLPADDRIFRPVTGFFLPVTGLEYNKVATSF